MRNSPVGGHVFCGHAECSQLPSNIPAYLINVIPQLTLNGNVTLQTGIISSALEHAVPEQIAVFVVKALSKVTQQGQRIYHITQQNQATVLPNINHHPDTMAEITAALNVGKEVIPHTDAISVPGWTGTGYIIFDPITGDEAYNISGRGMVG